MPPVAVTEFQNAVAELAAKSGEATDKLLARISRLAPAEARAFITDAYPALLDPFLKASGDLTVQWYAEQPAVVKPAGAAVFVPEPVLAVPGRQLAISGRWALAQNNPATALRGNATRQVLNASRDTVIVNAEREGVRWIREAKPDACGFCRMLATRSAKPISSSGRVTSYKSEGVFKDAKTGKYYLGVIGKRGNIRAGKQRGDKYHDHCRCIAVPLRDGRYDPPEYVQQWADEYDSLFMEYGSDPIQISRAMDAGRIRADRVGPLQGGPDLFEATAAAAAAPPEPPTTTTAADAVPVETTIDFATQQQIPATIPGDVLKRYSRIDPYNPDGATAAEVASSREYMAKLEDTLKTQGFGAFKGNPVLEVGADGKYAVISDGNHRVWAAGRAGFDDVPVTVITGEDSAWAKQYGFPVDDDLRTAIADAVNGEKAPNLDIPKAPAVAKPAKRDFDTVTAEFNAAVEAGDDALIDQLADELEAVEKAERKAAARNAKAAAKREATLRAQNDRVGELIDDGWNPDEAEAEAFGISVEKIRRRNFIAEARADGYRGAGFDELVTEKFRDMFMQQYWAAEDATNGFMIKQKYVLKASPKELWTASEARARKLMTPEMAEWFDQNGRITRAALRQSILDGNPVWRSALTEDFLR